MNKEIERLKKDHGSITDHYGKPVRVLCDARSGIYKKGDRAVLILMDADGDWWADFTLNDQYEGNGIWIISPQHFKLSGV